MTGDGVCPKQRLVNLALLYAGTGSGEWAAEGGAAPPAPLAATKLLDSILHVELHDFYRKFLADEVRPFCARLLHDK